MTTLRDPLEQSSGNYAPTLSFKEFGKRKPLVGIIVPSLEDDVQKPYRVTQQTKMGTNEPLFFNKRGTNEPDPEAPRTQIEITVLTDLRDWAGTSDNFQERQAERAASGEGREDIGLRRIIIKGKQQTDAFKDALKAVAPGTRPEVGGTLTTTLLKAELVGDKNQNTFGYEYAKPNPADVAKAQAAFDTLQAEGGDAGDQGGDEPPF